MYIGVDGGGTHTRFLLVDAAGRVLVRHQGRSAYYPEVGMEAVRATVHEGLRALLAAAGAAPADVRHAFLGLPMHGEDERTPELDALPMGVLPPGRWTCGNDMVCGWAGSLGGSDGINIVAGTGSIGYGEYAGCSARCGGWGELFSDEGSAYWIARQGLQLFSRMGDGRAARGPWYALLRAELALDNDLALGTRIAQRCGNDRSRLAAYSRLVDAAARAGDTQAMAILVEAGRELAWLVHAIRAALAVPAGASVRVSHSGGVFEGCAAVGDAFRSALAGGTHPYAFVVPRFEPVVGALLQAARLVGSPLDEAALARIASG